MQEILEKHQKWINNQEGGRIADLRGADLTAVNFTGISLSCANLTYTDLSETDLYGVDISGAKLMSANLSGADLTGANLSGADLRGADLTMTDLRDADLIGTDLIGTDLRGADLRMSNTYRTIIKSILNIYFYDIYYTDDICQIGCWNKTWEEWKGVIEDEKELTKIKEEYFKDEKEGFERLLKWLKEELKDKE